MAAKSLLPKVHAQFGEKDYWEKFFKKRGSKAFEWYGEYPQLSRIFQKYMKTTDKLLMLGCGNSDLSADLYDAGYANICNVDISENAIKLMEKKNQSLRPNMEWEVMDVKKMNFEDDYFNVIVDKGTLDALMTSNSEEVCIDVGMMFKEINRVLKPGGRYVCVSLLQSHILQFLMNWFANEGWLIRVHYCEEADKPTLTSLTDENTETVFPVFVIVCTKLKKIPGFSSVLEFSMTKSTCERLKNIEEMEESVTSIQHYKFVRNQLKKGNSFGENFFLALHTPNSKTPRYHLHVTDRRNLKNCSKTIKGTTPFAIFIVPQGRETEWLFGTTEGHTHLAETTKCQRLIVVHLSRDHTYSGLESVKEELSGKVMELAPNDLPSHFQVPFWSLGDDLGRRDVREEGTSDLSGDFVVEDVKGEDGQMFRRLVFLANRNVTQSEAKLKTVSGKKKGKKRFVVDLNFLACSHHICMIGGLAFLPPQLQDTAVKVLIIGLGGGGLAMFVHKHFPKSIIDVIDIDPKIVDIASNWFGFKTDDRMTVHVSDGLDFIQNSVKSDVKFNVIMLDVDGKDPSVGMSCPPQSFVSQNTLHCIRSLLDDVHGGLLVLNLVCRQATIKESVLTDVKRIFSPVYSLRVEKEVNDVIYCLTASSLGDGIKQSFAQFDKQLRRNCSASDQWDVGDMLSRLKLL